jgi:pyruvate/2-oxoglutarate dehydrogenase complex dihydrolipoamide dehydrogenase (E3) component
VTVVEATSHLLPPEEPESGALLADVFRRQGIDVRVDAEVVAVAHDANGFSLRLDGGETLAAEQLLVATGRRLELAAAGLDVIGVDVTARAVAVDGRMRVAPGVWAVGDMTGKGAFTHVSMYQAEIAVADILDIPGVPAADYRALPRVTFTDPEIASVGLTLAQARDAGIDVLVGKVELPATSRGWIHGPGNDGFIRLVADAGRRILVGATAVGPSGGEVMSALAVAIHAEVPVDRMLHMMYAYPTFHRGILDALRDLRQPS